jgi:hypothetical protein
VLSNLPETVRQCGKGNRKEKEGLHGDVPAKKVLLADTTRIALAVRPAGDVHRNRADRRMARRLVMSHGNQTRPNRDSGKFPRPHRPFALFPSVRQVAMQFGRLFLLQWIVGANERYSQHLSFLEPSASFRRKENARDRGIHG